MPTSFEQEVHARIAEAAVLAGDPERALREARLAELTSEADHRRRSVRSSTASVATRTASSIGPTKLSRNSSRASRRRVKATRCTSWRFAPRPGEASWARPWRTGEAQRLFEALEVSACRRYRSRWAEAARGARRPAIEPRLDPCYAGLIPPSGSATGRRTGRSRGPLARVRDPGCRACAGSATVVHVENGALQLDSVVLARGTLEFRRRSAVPGIDLSYVSVTDCVSPSS